MTQAISDGVWSTQWNGRLNTNTVNLRLCLIHLKEQKRAVQRNEEWINIWIYSLIFSPNFISTRQMISSIHIIQHTGQHFIYSVCFATVGRLVPAIYSRHGQMQFVLWEMFGRQNLCLTGELGQRALTPASCPFCHLPLYWPMQQFGNMVPVEVPLSL